MYTLNIQKQISVIRKSAHSKKKKKRERLFGFQDLYHCALRDHMDAINLPRNGKIREGKATQSLEETLSVWTLRAGAQIYSWQLII